MYEISSRFLTIYSSSLDSSLQNVTAESITDGSQLSTRDYASDNESGIGGSLTSTTVEDVRHQRPPSSLVGGVESWVLVNVVDKNQAQSDLEKAKKRESLVATTTEEPEKEKIDDGSSLIPSSRLRLPIVVVFQDWFALEKACDSIVFVVRDATHITPNNIEVSSHEYDTSTYIISVVDHVYFALLVLCPYTSCLC